MITLKIIDAKFTKDTEAGGWFSGKQDPLIRFKFGGKTLKTKAKADAGLEATWNESFNLVDI